METGRKRSEAEREPDVPNLDRPPPPIEPPAPEPEPVREPGQPKPKRV